MSPTERDLRAALRAGEGDDLDVDHVVAGGRSARAQRRSRIMNTTAAAVVVAGVATGGALLAGGGHGGTSKSNGAATADRGGAYSAPAGSSAASGKAGPPAAAGAAGSGTAGSGRSAAAMGLPTCPASLPRYLIPGTSVPSTGAAGGALFSGPVATAVVCSYGSLATSNAPPPTRVVLTGADATTLATSLENAAPVRPKVMCPQIRSADERELMIIGVAADGSVVGRVTTTINRPACDVRVTNGKAVRYAWSPPPSLANRLNGAGPVGSVSPGPVMNGSPTR